MDPVSAAMIVNAISIGADTATGVVVSDAVKSLHDSIKERFRMSKDYAAVPVATIDDLALSAEGKAQLEQILAMVKANQDEELIALSAKLIKQADHEDISLPAGIDINLVNAVISGQISIEGNKSDSSQKVDAKGLKADDDFSFKNNVAGGSKN